MRYELPDQSVVWLNSGTTLRYPTVFKKGSRTVELRGEAYFEVQADQDRPFYVKMPNNLSVYVYGTKFNISAYDDEKCIETVLEKGRVNVITPNHKTIVLSPGEQISYNKESEALRKEKVDVYEKVACTDAFDKWNINPNEVTPGEMGQDNLTTGAFFTQMEKGVFIVGVDKGGEYQITEMLAGDIFSGYVSNITTYSYATYHNDHYALYQGWYNAAFNDAYTDIMQPWISIQKEAEKNGTPAVGALADIVKVLGMSRITDMGLYGWLPYRAIRTRTLS